MPQLCGSVPETFKLISSRSNRDGQAALPHKGGKLPVMGMFSSHRLDRTGKAPAPPQELRIGPEKA